MSWKLKEALRRKLAGEQGAIVREPGARTLLALIYPNSYAVGMGNLAIHSLYRMANSRPDLACERFFLPDRREAEEYGRTGAELMSVEAQRPLSEFAVAAFSISFENDLLNLLPLFSLARIPYRAAMRDPGSPILVAGGAAATLNPAPLSAIFDAVVLGEAECFADDLFPLIAGRLRKEEALREMARIPGVWVPSVSPAPDSTARRFLTDLDAWPTETVIHSEAAEFGKMHLVELQRGCPFRCGFCATPAIYDPPRRRSPEAVLAMVESGLPFRKKFGLIGAHILSWPGFEKLARAIHERGATFSPSSIRASDLDDEKARLLSESGHRSVALGVEAGSEKLRETLGKNLSDEELMRSAATLARRGVTNLRLYFMIGLPGETDDDVAAIASISLRVLEAIKAHAPKGARQTSVAVTLSPFVPKPRTPFAGERFVGEGELKARSSAIKSLLRKERGVSVSADSPLSAAVEAYLSSAGPEAVEFLEGAARGENPRRLLPS